MDAVSVEALALSCLDAQAAREQTIRMLSIRAINFFIFSSSIKIVVVFDVIIIRCDCINIKCQLRGNLHKPPVNIHDNLHNPDKA